MKRRIAGLVFTFWVAGSALGADDAPVGYVLAADGGWTWVTPANTPVAVGDPVTASASARSSASNARLTIGLLDDSVKSFNCPPLNPCVASVSTFRAPAKSLGSRLMSVGKTFFSQREAMQISAISRGADAAQFQHAVLELQDHQLQVAPAIVQLDPGTFSFRLRSLQQGSSYSGQFSWAPPAIAAANAPAITPGVYELTVSTTEGIRLGSTPVLVATAATAASKRAALADGRKIVSGWPPDTDPDAINNFLTALLLNVSNSSP